MNSSGLMTLIPLILLILIMYFLLIRPQKKREKQVNAMRGALKVGDDVITIGGICGKIVKTKDETLIIQVGADKTKFEMMRWSISKVVSEGPAVSPKRPDPEEEETTVEKKSLPKKLKKTSLSKETDKTSETKGSVEQEIPEQQQTAATTEAPEAGKEEQE